MKMKILLLIPAIVVILFAPVAKADHTFVESYPCTKVMYGINSVTYYRSTCYREVIEREPMDSYPVNQDQLIENRDRNAVRKPYIDGNAVLRTGASIESAVILNTTQESIVTIHSWDRDWAYITMVTGDIGWTHRNNISYR